ncbi:MAG: DNA gyrase subunit A, partial [Cyanobacteria bacterium P01_A01_bin.135]
EKIAELVNNGRVEGIADIRDESDREGMRVVIELRRDAAAEAVLSELYRLTPLQSNFGTIMLCLAEGQPQQMSLRQMLASFLEFREQTLTRQYRHELTQAEQRRDIVAGLLVALENLDAVIDILRNAPDGSTAKAELQQRFDLSDRQGDAILAMPLRRLTGLERQRLQEEYEGLTTQIDRLNQLLSDRREFLKALKKELRGLKRQFGDPRRTRILSAAERAQEKERLAEIEAEVAEDDVVLEFTQQGYVRRSSPRAFGRRQAKAPAPSQSLEPVTDDIVTQIAPTTTAQSLLSFTSSGKAYSLEVGEIPATPRNSRGTPLVTLLPSSVRDDLETCATQFIYPDGAEQKDVILLTQRGRVKRLPLADFASLTARGLTALKLKEQDSLVDAFVVSSGAQLALVTSGGRLLRFALTPEQLGYTGRTAQGQTGIRISRREQLAGWALVPDGTAAGEASLLLMTARGYGKRIPLAKVRLGNRGDLGIQMMPFTTKTDQLIGLCLTDPEAALQVTTDHDRMAQIAASSVPKGDRSSSGKRVVAPTKGEKLTSVVLAPTASATEA